MNIQLQAISERMGQQINNSSCASILELDLEQIINLFKDYGVLLFRKFEADVDIFKKFSNSLSTDFMDYAGGAFVRRVINEDKTLLSVNDYQFEIKLHGEMYYQKNIPLLLWFFCANPAVKDGQTTICDGREFYHEISSSTKELFQQQKLKFTAHMPSYIWHQKYNTSD